MVGGETFASWVVKLAVKVLLRCSRNGFPHWRKVFQQKVCYYVYPTCCDRVPEAPHKMSTMHAVATQTHPQLLHVKSLCEACVSMNPMEFIKEKIKCTDLCHQMKVRGEAKE